MISYGNTKDLGNSVKCMIHAPAGYGKTKLIGTAPAPFVISTENGLLSIKKEGLPYMKVENMTDFKQSLEIIKHYDEFKAYKTIAIDSLSDIAQVCLADYKKLNKDPRQAYGQLNDELLGELKKWRNIDTHHIYITCQQAQIQDGANGMLLFSPDMPGKELPKEMPYWGDELFALRIVRNEDGSLTRWIQTQPDMQYNAKDRSGMLLPYEQPNLSEIFRKIQS